MELLNTAASLQLIEIDHAIRCVNALHRRLDNIEATENPISRRIITNGEVSISAGQQLCNRVSTSLGAVGTADPKHLSCSRRNGHFNELEWKRSFLVRTVPWYSADDRRIDDKPSLSTNYVSIDNSNSNRVDCTINTNFKSLLNVSDRNNEIRKETNRGNSRSSSDNCSGIPLDFRTLCNDLKANSCKCTHLEDLDLHKIARILPTNYIIRNAGEKNDLYACFSEDGNGCKAANPTSDGSLKRQLTTDQLFDEIFMINGKNEHLWKRNICTPETNFIEQLLLDTENLCAKMLQDDNGSVDDEDLHVELTKCQREIRLLRNQLREKSGGSAYKQSETNSHTNMADSENCCLNEFSTTYLSNGGMPFNVAYIDSSNDSVNHQSDVHNQKVDYRLHNGLRLFTKEASLMESNLSDQSHSDNNHNSTAFFSNNNKDRCFQSFNGHYANLDALREIRENAGETMLQGHENNYANLNLTDSFLEQSYEAKYRKMKLLIVDVQNELRNAKETLLKLKDDKKKLKAEKQELLSQMKEVYNTLESKETELRDLIRQFEQKMRDSDNGIQQLILERERLEKDKKDLEENARNNDELIEITKANLGKEQMESNRLKAQLKELQGRFALLTTHRISLDEQCNTIRTYDLSAVVSSTQSEMVQKPAILSDRLLEKCASQTDNSNQPLNPNLLPRNTSTPTSHLGENSAVLPYKLDFGSLDKNITCTQRARSADTRKHRQESAGDDEDDSWKLLLRRNRRQSTPQKRTTITLGKSEEENKNTVAENANCKQENRLSKLINNLRRTKSKDLTGTGCLTATEMDLADPISADLSLAEKAEKLAEARQMPVIRWRQAHVLAWLELELGMGQYAQQFSQNVKSGRVLINLTNSEVEKSLRIGNQMHKKKLRLAIEQYRAPLLWKFPLIKEITTSYVCSHFLPSIGLGAYIDIFRANLIDGRILNYINKDQLAKCLNVSKRFHQTSILKGVELLRMVDFDVKALNQRRFDSEKENDDLLVWTNTRMIKWLRQIDLEEYVGCMTDSGLHGAVVVLDSSFNADILANVLKIPSGKHMIRKHLADEFDTMQQRARSRLRAEHAFKAKDFLLSRPSPKRSISLGRGFIRSNTADADQGGFEGLANAKKRLGIRDSIVKALGLSNRNEIQSTDSEFVFKFDRCDRDTSVALSTASVATDLRTTDRRPSSMHAYNQSSATLSSTTSDLGSSIERSQHLNTILAPASQVLSQAPMTSISRQQLRKSSARAESSAHNVPSDCQDTSFDVKPIKMRVKKHADSLVAKRPHSMGDFGRQPLMSGRLNASLLVSNLLNKQPQRCNDCNNVVLISENGGSEDRPSESPLNINNHPRLKTCISVDSLRLAAACPSSPLANQKRFDRSPLNLIDRSPSSDRRLRIIETIAEYGETEHAGQQSQLEQNGSPSSVSIGSDQSVRHQARRSLDDVSSAKQYQKRTSGEPVRGKQRQSDGTAPADATSYVVAAKRGWCKRRTQSLLGLVEVTSTSDAIIDQQRVAESVRGQNDDPVGQSEINSLRLMRMTSGRGQSSHFASNRLLYETSGLMEKNFGALREYDWLEKSPTDKIHETDL